jgi:hypothetical protein
MLVEYSLLRGLLGRVSRCLGTAGALWDIYKKGAFPLAVFFFSFPHAHSTSRIVLKDIKQVPKVQVSYTNTQSSIIATTPHNITMSSKDSNEPTTNGTTAPFKQTRMKCRKCDYVPDFGNFTLERLDTEAHGQRCDGVLGVYTTVSSTASIPTTSPLIPKQEPAVREYWTWMPVANLLAANHLT